MTLSPLAIQAAATSLVDARRHAVALSGFPNAIPDTLDDAYAIQAACMRQWGGDVAGWKVGRLTGDWEQRFGVNRFIGPMYANSVIHA